MTSRPTEYSNEITGSAFLSGVTVQAGVVHGGIHFHQAERHHMPRPSQLPRAAVHFTDRRDHLAALDTLCAGTADVPLVALSGISGTGKLTLAVQWLRSQAEAERFADGQLYADLGRAGGPREVLRQWLRAFGHRDVPADLGELAGLWRSVTAGLSVAVLVDGVTDPSVVPDLMPGGDRSLTVVTSRRQLWELARYGAVLPDLGPLPPGDAVQLLTRYLGEVRVAADPAAARRIAEACACLPLALALTGARLATRGAHVPLGLIPTPTSSDPTTMEDTAIIANRQALDASYRALEPAAQGLYRQLGVVPEADYNVSGVAALAALPPEETGRLLLALNNARLLTVVNEEPREASYRFAAAVRAHARVLATSADDEQARKQTVRRWCDWVLWTATRAQKLLTPKQADTLPRDYAHQPAGPAPFHNEAGALAWLEDRQDSLLPTVEAAASAGFHDTVWQLADAHWPLFHYLHLYELWVAVHRIALDSARRAGNPAAVRQMLNSGAIGLSSAGQTDEALAWYADSLSAALEGGDVRDQGQAHIGMAGCHFNSGRLETAEAEVRKAIGCWESCGYPRGVALAWTLQGEIAGARDDLSLAVRLFTNAHEQLTRLDDPFDAARALAFRGHARTLDGHHASGLDDLGRALEVFDGARAERWQARVRHLLGEAHAAAGHPTAARSHLEDAATRYDRFAPAEAAAVRRALESL